MAKIWLMKSEPDVYSIDQLAKDKTTWWTGVRNYQARNFMMKEMELGDVVLFYHSNAEPPGIAGLGKVTHLAEPDPTQFEKKSEYFDPKATKEKANWFCVQVGFERKLEKLISLEELRKNPKLQELLVLKKGQRLSIQPVEEVHYREILKMEKK
ncbi:MAG: EVE domain-containing protein [Pseudobdellovibrionaceae bacterium]|jgi:predicted RNA-binding protein with PUA-like domain